MAAKFQSQILINAQLMQVVERIRGIHMLGKGFQLTGEIPINGGGVVMQLKHRVSLSSWGEKIEIALMPYGNMQTTAHIKSECSLPTQVIDWGKNKGNVNEIVKYLMPQ